MPTIEWQKADAQPLSSGNIRQIVNFFKTKIILLHYRLPLFFFRDLNYIYITFRMQIVAYINVLVCIYKNNIQTTNIFLYLASNLVGFGSEWTLKLSVRCKFSFNTIILFKKC